MTLGTESCRLLRVPPSSHGREICTEWRVWEDHGGAIIDTGWLPVALFEAMFEANDIALPSGWSGEIYFQARVVRRGLGDHAGDYSAALAVSVSEDE